MGFGLPSGLTQFQRWGPASPPPLPPGSVAACGQGQRPARHQARARSLPQEAPENSGLWSTAHWDEGQGGPRRHQRAAQHGLRSPGWAHVALEAPRTWPEVTWDPASGFLQSRAALGLTVTARAATGPPRHAESLPPASGTPPDVCRVTHVRIQSFAKPPHPFRRIHLPPRNCLTFQNTYRLLPV